MQRRRFRWDVLVVALLASLITHVALAPRLLLPLIERPEVPLEISYMPEAAPDVEAPSADEAIKPEPPAPPEEPPPPDETPIEKAERERKKRKKPDDKPLPPPPEVAQIEKKPEKKPEPPKPEEVKPVPPPPMIPLERKKMVDQNRPDDEPDNADAKYLAQTNHRAKEDTRSLDTNLVREMHGAESQESEPSQNQLPKPGMKEQKIAELQERKGKKNEVVRGNPRLGDEGQAKQSTQKPGKLSMRGLVPKSAEPTPEAKSREGVELNDPEKGNLPQHRVGHDEQRAASASKGNKVRPNLFLGAQDYEKIVGESVAAKERTEALAQRSHTAGRWDRVQKRIEALRSSLENFTPEVKVGNQAELGTRAHPFAAYIAEMHRSIHKQFAFGFLPSLDSKGIADPFNNMEMWVQLEIVLNADGSVEKVGIVRPSGYLPFDTAAIDAVQSSSPFPKPPNSIRSGNGKVYLDWRFHRDDRQCGTFGVDPHILLNGEEDKRPHDTTEVMASGSGGSGSSSRGSSSGVTPLPRSVTNSAPPPQQKESEDVQPGAELTEVPEAAHDAAEGWFSAYARGDVGWLAGWSAAPFQTGGEVSAKDGKSVKQMYAEMLKEKSAGRHVDKGINVMTPQAARQKLGGTPRGGDNETLYAVGKVGTDEFVLLLKKSNVGWRVCGLNRL